MTEDQARDMHQLAVGAPPPDGSAREPLSDEQWNEAIEACAVELDNRWYYSASHVVRALKRTSLAAAPQPALKVAEGWVMVPRKPTEAMMDAAEACSDDWPRTTWKQAWEAMLAAAGAPKKGERNG